MRATLVGVSTGVGVGEAAAAVGVSVRTLHHWDALGLVAPAARTPAGYRSYSPADVARARRVRAYRDLGVPLADVAALLDAPAERVPDVLRARRADAVEQVRRGEAVVEALDRLTGALERGVLLDEQEQVAVFGPGWHPGWNEEAHRRWGDTPQWTEHAERSAARSAQDWQRLADEVAEVETDLVAALTDGVLPGSTAADVLAERHRAAVGQHFDCTHAMHVCLARSYLTDPRFTAHHEALAPGLTRWLSRVVDENARAHGVDPDTATWT